MRRLFDLILFYTVFHSYSFHLIHILNIIVLCDTISRKIRPRLIIAYLNSEAYRSPMWFTFIILIDYIVFYTVSAIFRPNKFGLKEASERSFWYIYTQRLYYTRNVTGPCEEGSTFYNIFERPLTIRFMIMRFCKRSPQIIWSGSEVDKK